MRRLSPFEAAEIKGVPRWESLRGAVKFIANPLPVIDNAIDTYGPTYYTRTIGDQRIIMTLDPDIAQHVLQQNNKNYYKSHLQVDSLGKYVGIGLLTANGDYWHRQRRLIQPGFYKSKLTGLISIMHDEILRYCDELQDRIKETPLAVNASDEMMRLTLRIVSRSLFGTGISDDKIVELDHKFTELQRHIVLEVRQPIFNWWRKLSGKTKKAMALAEEIKDILRKIIQQRRQSGERRDDLLDMLLYSRYEDTGEQMSDQQILNEALILFTAGHETTANALSWALYLLSQHSQLIENIHADHQTILDDRLSMSSLMTATHTQHIISEVMRLYPPAWILDRMALDDDQVKGISINKGDLIGIYIYGLHRHQALWEAPKEFRPERFEIDKKERHKYQYIPFGGGPRLCIGHHFAMIEMQLVLGELLSRYSWSYSSDTLPQQEPLITLRPKGGIRMKITLR